jgi:hypothetical protein
MKVLYVEWEDAAASIGWGDGSTDDVSSCVSIGKVVKETSNALILAGTWGAEDSDTNCRIAIPKGWIRKRKVLKV